MVQVEEDVAPLTEGADTTTVPWNERGLWSTSPPSVGDAGRREVSPAVADRLRELRTCIQDLHTMLDSVRSGEISLARCTAYVDRTDYIVREIFRDLPRTDDIIHLHNIAAQMWECTPSTPSGAAPDAREQAHYLRMMAARSRDIVFHVGLLTIPARINEWLARSRPGSSLAFHAVFESDLPTYDDRVKLLTLLATSPGMLQGALVDLAGGVIYRAAARRGEMLLRGLWIAGGLAVATAVVIGATAVGQRVAGWPIAPRQLPALALGWGAIVVGVIVQTGMAAARRANTQAGVPSGLSIKTSLLLLSAQPGPLLLKLGLAFIGFWGLVFATGADHLMLLTFFLAGYALDSVGEIFGADGEPQRAAQSATLAQQMAGRRR